MPIEKKKRSWLWPAVIIVVLAAGGYWWWHHSHGQPSGAAPGGTAGRPGGGRGGPGGMAGIPQPPTPVRVTAAQTQDMDVFIRSLGTVTAYNTATVHSKVDGELQQLLFREGQYVKAGAPLAQLDPATYKVALEQAEGALEQNKAQLDNARKDLQRYQTLFAQDSIARQQVDTQAALVRQYEGTLKTNQAAVDNARLQLGYTKVTAPISGRLGLRQVDLGNIVHTSDTNGIVVITQTQPISVVFTIAESDLPAVLQQVRGGHALPVMAYDRADINHLTDGTLATVDNQIDVATGTVKLKATFENKDESLFPNQFINVRLRVNRLQNATVIPAGAVQRGTPGTFVYAVGDDDVVHVRVLKLGPTDGDRIVVLDGLKPGENVVTEGVDRLREGAKVQIVTGNAESAVTPAAPALGPGQRGQRRQRSSGSADR